MISKEQVQFGAKVLHNLYGILTIAEWSESKETIGGTNQAGVLKWCSRGNLQVWSEELEQEKLAREQERIAEETQEPSKAIRFRRWTPARRDFYLECNEYLCANQPLAEPTGADGKRIHAEWRANKGLSYVDPVLSNLSTWTSALKDRGYVYQDAAGNWCSTGKKWAE